MRCVEALEELAAPRGRDSTALAAHLAHCPRCAAHARQGTQFDRLWEATRPEEPTPETWATVWAQVTQTLDTAPILRFRPSDAPRPHPWRRRAVAMFGIAQAAALLVGAWLVTRPDPGRPTRARTQTQAGLALKPATNEPKAKGEETVARPDPDPSPSPFPSPAVGAPAVLITATSGAEIEIDYGALVMIQSGPGGVTVVSRATDDGSSALDGNVDGNFVMLNILEAMAE